MSLASVGSVEEPTPAVRFRIVPRRSRVAIEACSSLHPIVTRTDGVTGFVDLDVSDVGRLAAAGRDGRPAGRMTLLVQDLRSGNRFEDHELHRHVDARRFPTIEGELARLRPNGKEGHYVVLGDILFHGVRRTYESEMSVALDGDGTTVRMAGVAVFDMRDFGLEPPRMLMLRIHPAVEVRVEIVAEREGA